MWDFFNTDFLSSIDVVFLLRSLSVLCWIALAVFAAMTLAIGLGFARRWRLGWVEELFTSVLGSLEAERHRLEHVGDDLIRRRVESPPNPPLRDAFDRPPIEPVVEPPRKALSRAIRSVPSVIGQAMRPLLRLRRLSMARVERACASAAQALLEPVERTLAFLYVAAPAAGAAGTMSGITAALYVIQASGSKGLSQLPLGDLSDALLTTFVGCAIVMVVLYLRFFALRRLGTRLTDNLQSQAREILQEYESMCAAHQRLNGLLHRGGADDSAGAAPLPFSP